MDTDTPGSDPLPVVTEKRALIEYLEGGCKPVSEWRIGTEHEKFAFHLSDLAPITYEGQSGVRALLEGLVRFGWKPVLEKGNPIALVKPDMSSISLEPAGQIELSGAQLLSIHQTCAEVNDHLRQVKVVGAELGIAFMGLGYQPKDPRESLPWMPKRRYEIMRRYMPMRGTMGLEMMQSTCTVQVNLDFASEANMVRMFRVGMALQPIATALWANSPFKEGKPNGYLSYRSHIWTDTDPDRAGTLPFLFEAGFGFERYVDYLLDVPMYFVNRNGNYIDVAGQSFRAFLDGRLPGLPGERPTLVDWADHVTTAFPEVRMKRYLEMRGADGGPRARLCALPAFWAGLLYDSTSLDAAWDLVKDWTAEEHDLLRRDVPRLALKTPFRSGTVRDLAGRALELATAGLTARAQLDSEGRDESHFLLPLRRIVDSGKTPAEELLGLYHGPWNGSVDPVFSEFAY
jgi:glutamate--cysteine ligase